MNKIVNLVCQRAAFCGTLSASLLAVCFSAMGQGPSSLFPLPPPAVSTVPSNGDVNPYGVAFVPQSVFPGGAIQPHDILVSNFNNSQNLQGTGTTVVRVDAHGNVSTFFQGSAGLGLTAALGVVRRGIVFVGNMPTTDGTSATVKAGSLLVLDRNANLIWSLTDPSLINGPWGLAIADYGEGAKLFVSNVLNGTVTRLDVEFANDGESLVVLDAVTIASGYNHRLDPAALVLGPSGLYYDEVNDILYVASSADNAVYAINGAGWQADSSQGTGTVIYQDNTHLHGPIDLVRTPSGHLIVANSDGSNVDPNQPSELVEFTIDGTFVAQYSVDKNNGGAFGVRIERLSQTSLRVAAVDDNANTLSIFVESVY
jgi:hypothetical protein